MFLIGFSLPAILYTFSVKKRPLYCVDLVDDYDSITLSNWLSKDFQSSFSMYMHDNLGMLAFFINVRNQLDYSLFGLGHTDGVVCGKNNYLFESVYIDAATGKDFVGAEVVTSQVEKVKYLQVELEKRGKEFLFCFATGKGSYYPEFIPSSSKYHSYNNHDEYVKEFGLQDVNHVDCVPWFLEMKDSLGHLLFPKYGIHWSYYSSLLVADSLMNVLSDRAGWDFPEIVYTSEVYSYDPRFRDYDMGTAMNLFSPVKLDKPMFYPEHEWNGEAEEKKSLLIIGDSYTWDIFLFSGIDESCFDTINFWYYNQSVFPESGDGIPTLTRHVDLHKVLKKYDAFLIMTNEPNLTDFGWGFVDEALLTLKDSNYVRTEFDDLNLRKSLKGKHAWRKDIESRAKSRGVTVKEMTDIYLLDKNYKPYPNANEF